MRDSAFHFENTTRVSCDFMREALSPRAKALAAVIASFQTIPGWQLNKSHIRAVCHGAAGFDAAWSTLLKSGILRFSRLKNEKGLYYYDYRLDLARVCGGKSFAAVPNEALRSSLSLNAKWLYTVCASVMTLPDFIFDPVALRKRTGFGHYCYYFAYTELRDTEWLLVERVPGQKHRRYSLTRGDRSVVASSSLLFRAARLAEQYRHKSQKPSAEEQKMLMCAHYQKQLSSCPTLHSGTAETCARLLADIMSDTRAQYRIGGTTVSGDTVRSRFASATPSQLQQAVARVQRVRNIRNLPGYLLTALFRMLDPINSFSSPPVKSIQARADEKYDHIPSYDLKAFEAMCLNDTYEEPLYPIGSLQKA